MGAGASAWPDAWADALRDAALRQASSAAIFQRGKAYATTGAVAVVDEDLMPEPALRARVSGTQTYGTEVWIEQDAVVGSCDCLSAADGGFCKHRVALALVWRDRRDGDAAPVGSGGPEQAQPTASKAIKTASTELEKRQALQDFLQRQDPATLADKLLELADRDHGIAGALPQWHKASTLGKDPAELKRLISEMLSPGRDFIAWNASASYVGQALAALPLLQQARSRDAGAAVALRLHALHCVWQVLQNADDSDGEIGGLCTDIGAEWVLSLQATGPQQAGFGDSYLQLQLQLDDPFGCFDAAAADAAMGEPAMARYRHAIAECWRQAKDVVLVHRAEHAAKFAKRKGYAPVDDDSTGRDVNLSILERLHLAQLEATGQVDQALAVLREDLPDAHVHSKLIAYLEAHGRCREAFGHAKLACQIFPADWRLQDDLLRCYEREGWTTEALALRRQQFAHSPAVDRDLRVFQAGLAAGQDVVALRQSLLAFLAGLEAKMQALPPVCASTGMAVKPAARPAPDVSLRAEVLCSEDRWAEACALVQPPAACRDAALHEIAQHLPPDTANQALALMLRVFGSTMRSASSPYRDALALVVAIGRRLAAAQRAAWLDQLRVDYKAKRNFIRDLPQD